MAANYFLPVRPRQRLVPMMAVLATACGSQIDEPRVGVYRAVLELPGGEAPFGLEVAQEAGDYVLYLSNGNERTRARDARLQDGELIASFSDSENSLHARMYRKALQGHLSLIEADSRQTIPFKATFAETFRFHKQSQTDNADLSGRWSLELISGEGQATRAIASLEQQHDRITGTITTPVGSHQTVEGQVDGDTAQMSGFAGAGVHLYRLQVDLAGDLQGDYWQGLGLHRKVIGQRDEETSFDGDELSNARSD